MISPAGYAERLHTLWQGMLLATLVPGITKEDISAVAGKPDIRMVFLGKIQGILGVNRTRVSSTSLMEALPAPRRMKSAAPARRILYTWSRDPG